MSAHDQSAVSVTYRLSLARPESHLVDVEVDIAAADGEVLAESLELAMAAWSPGSYLIRDYARFVRNVRASANGDERAVSKLDKQTWRVSTGGASRIAVQYQVYGRDLTVRTNHIDGTHGFLHGPATYLMVDGQRDRPCRVEVNAPAGRGWSVVTGLPASEGRQGSAESNAEGAERDVETSCYRAESADHLLDCPIHIGPVQERSFDVFGTHIRLCVWGRMEPGPMGDLDRLTADLMRIVEVHAARLGERIPCDTYTFLLMLSPNAYGGLEHKNSSANLHTPFCMESAKGYYGLLELLSHEFFHVWNGKRIFPEALGRFDYRREAHTRCLWVMEGLTSYYDRYAVLRAGCLTSKHYFKKLCEEWSRLRAIPGRFVQSLEESSFNAWIKLYKPNESNVNTTVSYYLEGGLAALVLDLQIRHQSAGKSALDDILTRLWREYGQTGEPYPEDLQPLFESATGLDLSDFFQRVIRGRKEPDLSAALQLVGLRLVEVQRSDSDEEQNTAVWLGVNLDSGTRIGSVLDESPAARAGLSPGDTIIACQGWQIKSESDLNKRLRARKPGDRVELAAFRRRQLIALEVELAEAPPKRVEILAIDNPSEAQSRLYRAWLGEEHPGAGKLAAATGARWV